MHVQRISYHSHFGEVEEPVVGEVRGSFLDEGEIGQVHAQVGDAGRIGAMKSVTQIPEAAVVRDERLKLLQRMA